MKKSKYAVVLTLLFVLSIIFTACQQGANNEPVQPTVTPSPSPAAVTTSIPTPTIALTPTSAPTVAPTPTAVKKLDFENLVDNESDKDSLIRFVTNADEMAK